MKIVTVVGARPQFIKAAMVSRAIREHNNAVNGQRLKVNGQVDVESQGVPLTVHRSPLTVNRSPLTEIIVHTGQHYDHAMSQVFFDQLEIPEPNYHLEIGSVSRGEQTTQHEPFTINRLPLTLHGDQTGQMLAAIEKVLLEEKPDAILVYGDTNSTLAGALAAAKLHIPVGHVEGGMRSFNRRMPEEINRVLTDHVAKWHFCATETAVKNLRAEGITEGVHLVGDVMHDAAMLYKAVASTQSEILEKLGLLDCHSEAHQSPVRPKNPDVETSPITNHQSPITQYALATIHRAENTDDPARLRNIVEALAEISKAMPVIVPLHPRTRKAIDAAGLSNMVRHSEAARTTARPKKGVILSAAKDPDGQTDVQHGVDSAEGNQGLIITDPLSYLDTLQLEQHASVILTDSGGMQKEAFWLGVPCVTMRDETEWVETVEAGWNVIAGADKGRIMAAVEEALRRRKGSLSEKEIQGASSAILDRLVLSY